MYEEFTLELAKALIETQGRHDSKQDQAVAVVKKLEGALKALAEKKDEPADPVVNPFPYGFIV